MAQKYRKKPAEIEALRVEPGMTFAEVYEFTQENARFPRNDIVIVSTLEGEMSADIGDYIVRGTHGEFYPVRRDIFEENYERVD